MIYDWHQETWQNLTQNAQHPHAYLFVGKENIGKKAFALHFAQLLLCERPTPHHEACGVCPSCQLFEKNAHPDFYVLSPELPENESSATRQLLNIKIDAVREILSPLNQSSIRGGKRVVLIYPAESMNIQAANALLKMLEEPPESVIFLLVSHNKDRVLATIKSRCRQWILPAPDFQTALRFVQQRDLSHAEDLLAFHSGAPLFADEPEQNDMRRQLLNVLAEPRLLAILDFAAAYDKQKWALAILLDWLHKWLIDLGLAQNGLPPVYYPQCANALNKLGQKTNPATLFRVFAHLNRLNPYGHHSLNVKMQAEFLLCEYLNFTQNKNT